MIDCEKILAIADRELAGTDLFTVSCKCTPMNEVELLIDSDTHVTIERCVELSRKIEAEFNRDEEDFSLTVASAGIGTELQNIRQYRKLIGSSVEVLLLTGIKILAKLDGVTDDGITISYEEKQAVEGKKRKVLVNVERTYRFDEIKYTKEYLDFK
ncbi:MAG: ribosome assembly cofactor RimP [Alistipes sp.]|nr:ribosome assembly cofactor RimP [Alistipes sp.]MBO5984803.1 ribosome assembly cofactor RimP [Rikenellaceae bacterium]MBO7344274.1 ribosome assembly cofactor RimP [Alistipes sp.]